jgi:hypothetical protein
VFSVCHRDDSGKYVETVGLVTKRIFCEEKEKETGNT